MKNWIDDIGANVPKSKTRQLLAILDIQGEFEYLSNPYIRQGIFRKIVNSDHLYFMNSVGEFMIESHLMYGVLHSVKIMNANGEFLDKEGNVTTEENAATLFDTIDAKDGKIDYKIQFTHTTLSAHKPFSMAQLSGYIKSLAADLHGQYDTKMKSEIQRTAFGHIVMSMRKWIVRTTGLRLRGAEYAFKDYDDMDMYEKGFIESTNEFKEGYYVSAVRFFGGIAKSIKKDYRNPAIRANWEKMTPAQKRDIIKRNPIKR
jgi:hypothetical protein